MAAYRNMLHLPRAEQSKPWPTYPMSHNVLQPCQSPKQNTGPLPHLLPELGAVPEALQDDVKEAVVLASIVCQRGGRNVSCDASSGLRGRASRGRRRSLMWRCRPWPGVL